MITNVFFMSNKSKPSPIKKIMVQKVVEMKHMF